MNLDEINPSTNTGLLPEAPRPTDYVAGSTSPLSAEDVNPSGDWSGFKVSFERQSRPGIFDTQNCTAFALTNLLELWLDFYRTRGLLPASHLAFLQDGGYLDSTGAFDFSERALGSMAGTGPNGNYLTTVLDAARHNGLAANRTWSWDNTKQLTFSEYYKTPNQETFNQAKRFLDYFGISYEWYYVDPANNRASLKKAPLYTAIATCPGWQTDQPVKWCGVTSTNHAVVTVKQDMESETIILDSYPVYLKKLALNYQIPYALRVYLTIKPVNEMNLIKEDGTVYLVGPTGKMGIADEGALKAYTDLGAVVTDGTTSVPQVNTATSAVVIHK